MSLYDSAYYYTLRTASRQKVADAINAKVKTAGSHQYWNRITLCSINKAAIDYARLEWPKYYSDSTHNGLQYSWDKLLYKFAPRPSYFDLAIWQRIGDENVLQGLALGKPSNGKGHLTINWVERSYAPTYMRPGILLPLLSCAEEYAKLLGCARVLIKDPADPSIYGRYRYEPFTLKKCGGSYLSKEVCYGRENQS